MEATLTTSPPATAVPCFDCGTTGGPARPGYPRPIRRRGEPYGVAGMLCDSCRSKRRQALKRAAEREQFQRSKEKAAAKSAAKAIQLAEVGQLIRLATVVAEATACDLCGVGRGRYDGSEFELEGRICVGCREELRDERALQRLHELAKAEYRYEPAGGSLPRFGDRLGQLQVLNDRFTRDDLTPKAAVALILAETKRVFDRRVAS